ncbi:MAG TPA: SGNH/GDSL hydrolase family protein [Thermoguttaceae bacterium]|nr:SGNH/GDSL hydrolase family protein [Thermoguttaceae bacterium]
MRHLLRAFILLAVSFLAAVCGAAEPVLQSIELDSGDTLVFCGDSITHQCLYTQYVEDFFYTRYPERKIRFHNAGIGGDRAFDALKRFDRDIAAYEPKYVTILLGMNDGSYVDFDRAIFDKYEQDMTELLDKLQGIGATAIVMTPTMFDQVNHRVRMEDPNSRGRIPERSPYYNAVLAFYGTWLREVAFQRGLGFVNMWGPLNDISLIERKTDPTFTLIPDSIHPAEAGQAVMAVAIVNDLTPERRSVSRIAANRSGDQWNVTARGGSIENVEGDSEGLSFVFTAESLPWVLPPEASLGFDLTKAPHRLSNEQLQVAGLKPGKYEVRIDGTSIGPAASHVKLGFKLELQSNPGTPQYQQALEVALLNKDRNDKAVHPLRDLWRKPKSVWRAETIDQEKLKATLAEIEPTIQELEALAAEYEAKIYATAKPVPRKYEIVRVSD